MSYRAMVDAARGERPHCITVRYDGIGWAADAWVWMADRDCWLNCDYRTLAVADRDAADEAYAAAATAWTSWQLRGPVVDVLPAAEIMRGHTEGDDLLPAEVTR